MVLARVTSLQCPDKSTSTAQEAGCTYRKTEKGEGKGKTTGVRDRQQQDDATPTTTTPYEDKQDKSETRQDKIETQNQTKATQTPSTYGISNYWGLSPLPRLETNRTGRSLSQFRKIKDKGKTLPPDNHQDQTKTYEDQDQPRERPRPTTKTDQPRRTNTNTTRPDKDQEQHNTNTQCKPTTTKTNTS
jgi:hypothetical protein